MKLEFIAFLSLFSFLFSLFAQQQKRLDIGRRSSTLKPTQQKIKKQSPITKAAILLLNMYIF